MTKLYDKIRAMLEEYYDKKLINSDYYHLQEVWDIIEEFICEMQEMADDQERKLDDFIQDCEEKELEERERLKMKGIRLWAKVY